VGVRHAPLLSSQFGPGFQVATSRLYRTEYAAASAAIIGYLIWRTYYLGGIDWLQVIFWAAFPDLASFIPIGVSSKRREWPSWGATLYNVFHTLLVWGTVFAALWAATGTVYWPLFGWLGHITVDRASGYGLRARPVAQKLVQ
jgi:Domain of unknown function (DUF4260)